MRQNTRTHVREIRNREHNAINREPESPTYQTYTRSKDKQQTRRAGLLKNTRIKGLMRVIKKTPGNNKQEQQKPGNETFTI